MESPASASSPTLQMSPHSSADRSSDDDAGTPDSASPVSTSAAAVIATAAAAAATAEAEDARPVRGFPERKTKAQQDALERAFTAQRRPRYEELKRIAVQLGLSLEATARWFRNRRHRQVDRDARMAHRAALTLTAAKLPGQAGPTAPDGTTMDARGSTVPAARVPKRGYIDDDVDQAWAKLWQLFAMPYVGKAAAAGPVMQSALDDGKMRVPLAPIVRTNAAADGSMDDDAGRTAREPVDLNLLDGLRRMFERHRAYLSALAVDVSATAPAEPPGDHGIRRPIPMRHGGAGPAAAQPAPNAEVAPAPLPSLVWRAAGTVTAAAAPHHYVVRSASSGGAATMSEVPFVPAALPASWARGGHHGFVLPGGDGWRESVPSSGGPVYTMYGPPIPNVPVPHPYHAA